MGISIFNSPFSIVNHRLMGGGVVHLVSAKNTRRLEGPDMIVLHYTAGNECREFRTFPDPPGRFGLGSRGDRSGGGGVPAGTFQHRGVARGEELVRRAWRVEPLLDRDRAG